MPAGRYGAAVAAINNNIASDVFVSGGYKNGIMTDSTNHFMPVNNTWAPSNSVAKMPKAVYQASAATVKNKIYIAGGYDVNFSVTNSNQIYDPANNSWASGFSMSSPVENYAIGVYNDSIIYYIGGYSGSVYRNTVQLFIPSSFLWVPGTSLPVSGAGWRGGIIGNKIVITGGFNSANGVKSSTYVGTIDPANPYIITWVTGTDYPGGAVTSLAGGASLDAASGLVLFTGGDPTNSGAQQLNYTFAYDVNVNQWKVGPPKPTAAYDFSNFTAVVDNDSLYMVAIGGSNSSGALAVNEWLNLGPFQLVIGVNENNNLAIALGNSPNPFNEFTKIQFSLARKSNVKATIVDVLGNELEILADKNLNPGSHELTWNASAFSSGIYFCRVTVDGKTATQKLVKF